MNKQHKENFCGACLALPAAMTGVGLSATSSIPDKNRTEQQQKKKKIIFFTGLFISIISISWAFYLLFIKKNCKECISK